MPMWIEDIMLVEITLKIPQDLARDAQEFGLLEQDMVTQLLQEELDRRVNQLVNEEIHDYRAEKRARHNSE
jgi:hypothetical protein